MNLDAYLERIHYAGPLEPKISVLRDILVAHSCSIPFENLDVLLGRGISLDDDDIERKLVNHRRGGYCFEQNSLLLRVLSAIGFSVSPLSARVRLNLSRETTPPRTHLFLGVQIDEVHWLADVGVGGLSPTGPFQLDLLDVEQPTPHESRRIICEAQFPLPRFFHQAKLDNTWVDVYEFTREGMPEIDREVSNCWTSTHKNSKFRRNLFAGLARPDGTRISINNCEFTHRRGTAVLKRFEIEHPEQLLQTLEDYFGLRFPVGTRFKWPGAPW